MSVPSFGFIGAGRMATALGRGFVQAGLATAQQVVASDPSEAAAHEFHKACGGRIVASNAQVAAEAQVLFLAVKPQYMSDALSTLQGVLNGNHLVISIAAGIRLAALANSVAVGGADGMRPRLVRVMPNTPCLIGQGASAYCLGQGATRDDGELVGRLLSAVGRAFEVPEKLLDAVTGLSGSGPAYVYLMIEALSDGGVRMGLPRDVATSLAAQTLRGAAEMVLSTGQHPGVLKDQVTSPGGTTIAGLQALEEHGVRAGLMAAVQAATERSQELGT